MRIAATTVFILAVGLGPVFAKGGPPSRPAGSKAPKVAHTTTPRGGAQHGGPKVTSSHGPAARAKAPVKTAPARGASSAKTTTRNAKTASTRTARGGAASSGKASTKTAKQPLANSASTSTTSGSTTATATTTTTLGPNVPKNPKLQNRLLAMLPEGMTLNDAAAGFKNQGQFIAAVHVSNNLGVPFSDLKMRMVDDGLSLGQAIQAVKPTADATSAARLGQQQAEADLQ